MSTHGHSPDRPHRYIRRLVRYQVPGVGLMRFDEASGPPCKTCGGSELDPKHLLAPAPRPRPETIARRLAAWAEFTSRPGWERRLVPPGGF